MTTVIPKEADWEEAPSLLDGAANLELTVQQCDLAYWFTSVAQGTLQGRPLGHSGDLVTPEYMKTPGPLRDALSLELAYRTLDEEAATRVLADYVATAPGIPELEFFSSQLIDEARHHMIFRNHLIDLGHPKQNIMEWVQETGSEYAEKILKPIREFATQIVRDERDFVGGVVSFAIIIEGVLAAATELSEIKWKVLDPVAGEVARGASIDEIRHLAVGSSFVRQYLIDHPESRDHVLDILRRGRKLWETLEDKEFVMQRERLYQEGMQPHAELLKDYELYPGRRLIETTPEERWELAARWNDELADARLAYMGIPEAIDLLRAQAPRIL